MCQAMDCSRLQEHSISYSIETYQTVLMLFARTSPVLPTPFTEETNFTPFYAPASFAVY